MKLESNPYESPNALSQKTPDRSVQPPARGWRFAWLLAYMYPVWLVGAFYATWLVAWVELGHRPRPMLDDPKYIGGLMDFVYGVPGYLLLGLPVLAPLGFAASFFCQKRTTRERRGVLAMVLAAFYVLMCVTAIVVLRYDGASVVEWWFD